MRRRSFFQHSERRSALTFMRKYNVTLITDSAGQDGGYFAKVLLSEGCTKHLSHGNSIFLLCNNYAEALN